MLSQKNWDLKHLEPKLMGQNSHLNELMSPSFFAKLLDLCEFGTHNRYFSFTGTRALMARLNNYHKVLLMFPVVF